MDEIVLCSEPMDIDVSDDNSIMHPSYLDNTYCGKKSHKEGVPKISNESPLHREDEYFYCGKAKKLCVKKCTLRSHCYRNYIPMLTYILMIFVVVCCYFVSNPVCYEMDVDAVKGILYEKLYGQNKAIKSTLDALGDNSPNKIIIFYGGTGVGKTYMSNLIFNNSWNNINIYHYTTSNFKYSFSSDLMIGLITCKSSYIIIDGLGLSDLDIQHVILEVVVKAKKLKKYITFILIYHTDIITESFKRRNSDNFDFEIRQMLGDIDAVKYFVHFEKLSKEAIARCIKDELQLKVVDKGLIEKVGLNFDMPMDGCKNVHQKIKTLNLT